MRPLRMTASRSEEIENLSSLNSSTWEGLLSDLSNADPSPLTLEELSNILAERVGERDGGILAKTLISLRRLADQESVDVDVVLDAMTRGLVKFGWKNVKIKKWNAIVSYFRQIIEHDATEIVAKSSDLYYSNINHIHDMKIISDLRPIFDAKRDNITAFITTNYLFLTYSDRYENEETIQLAIGLTELEHLKEEIENALKKSQSLDELVNLKLNMRNRFYKAN